MTKHIEINPNAEHAASILVRSWILSDNQPTNGLPNAIPSHDIAIAFAAIFFGFLTEGKNSLDRTTDIPPDILFALQAFVIIFIAAPAISKWVIDRLKILKQRNEDAPTLEEENVNE